MIFISDIYIWYIRYMYLIFIFDTYDIFMMFDSLWYLFDMILFWNLLFDMICWEWIVIDF